MSRTPEEEAKAQSAFLEFRLLFANAFSAWQSIEAALYRLYGLLFMGPPGKNESDMFLANVIYHSLVHLDNRIKLIDDIAEYRVKNQAKLDEWHTLLSAIKKRKRTRDKLAHWTMLACWHEDKFDRVVLSKPVTDIRNILPHDFPKPSSGAIQASDLIEYAKQFEEMSSEIGKFILSLMPKS